MRVNSSGLGKTTMFAKITLVDVERDSSALRMCIEAVDPVHWYITIRMGPTDVWHLVKSLVGSPLTLVRMLAMVVKGAVGPEEIKVEVPPHVPPIVKASEVKRKRVASSPETSSKAA